MAQINKGTVYSTGDQVTAANLNALVDNAFLLSGAITEQPAASSVNLSDSTLVAQSTGLKKVSIAQIGSALAIDTTAFLKKDGSVAMDTNQQLTLGTTVQTNDLHASSKGYVDTKAAGYLPLTGGTLTGPLTLQANPTTALGAATKQYVDVTSERVVVTKMAQRQRADTLLRQWAVANGGLIVWARTNAGASGTYWSDDRTLQQTRPQFNVSIPAGVTVVDVASSLYYTICLLSNGWVYTTGNNAYGQLGHGDTTNRVIFTRIEYFITNNITISKIANGGSRLDTYAISAFVASNGDLYTCGYNAHGGLGINSTTNASTPTKVTNISSVSEVIISDCYVASFLALKTNGDLYGWGDNRVGALGLGTADQFTSPQLITSSVLKADITKGGYTNYYNGHMIVLKTNGEVYTTGYNGYGQLGLGNTTNRTALTKITTLPVITDIGCNGGYWGQSYAVSEGKRLYAWGYNSYGAVGDNTTTNATSPYNVNKWAGNLAQDPPFVGKTFTVFPGPSSYSYTVLCIIDSDGRVYMVGANSGMANGNTSSCLVWTEIVPTLRTTTEKPVTAKIYLSDSDIVISILTDAGNLYSVGRNNWGACNVGLDDNSPTYRYTFNRQLLYV
jgi:alpha-tubulin suppressor-like RCC1 family protein